MRDRFPAYEISWEQIEEFLREKWPEFTNFNPRRVDIQWLFEVPEKLSEIDRAVLRTRREGTKRKRHPPFKEFLTSESSTHKDADKTHSLTGESMQTRLLFSTQNFGQHITSSLDEVVEQIELPNDPEQVYSILDEFERLSATEWKRSVVCQNNCKPLEECRCLNTIMHTGALERWWREKLVSSASSRINFEQLVEGCRRRYDRTFSFSYQEFVKIGRPCFKVFSLLFHQNRCHLAGMVLKSGVTDKDLDINQEIFEQSLHGILRHTKYHKQADIIVHDILRDKWAYFPAELKLHMDLNLQGTKAMMPFCRKLKLGTKGGTASIYYVTIQEDFVSDARLRNALEYSSYNDPFYGRCYRMILKTYWGDKAAVFEQEKKALISLIPSNQVPISRYLGSFTHDYGEGDACGRTYNFLLEYGESDLAEVWGRDNPPKDADDMFQFWQPLCEIAKSMRHIHNYDDAISSGGAILGLNGHGDIKPSSIINIHGCLKLADFGFSRYLTATHIWTPHLRTEWIHALTDTYGAPEVSKAKRSADSVPIHIPSADIWSFGCVLSVAATWAVLGSQGVIQYEKLRKQSRSNKRAGVLYDRFHDGIETLPEINNWHNYLRGQIHQFDPYTARILDLVKEKMIRTNVKARIASSELYGELREILRSPSVSASLPQMQRPDSVSLDLKALSELGGPSIQDDSGYASQSRPVGSHVSSRPEDLRLIDGAIEGERNMAVIDDDIESMISDSFDIGSNASVDTSIPAREAKLHLARMLATHPDLAPLCKKALSRMDRGRFVNATRRLLKAYYRNMLELVSTEQQRLSVNLLHSRLGRHRIGTEIAKAFDVNEEEELDRGEEVWMNVQRRAEFLNTWLMQVPRVTASEALPSAPSKGDDIETSSSAELESETDTQELPQLAEMESFFRETRPFNLLLNEFRKLLLPRQLREIISSVPREKIEISRNQNGTVVNRIKGLIEDFTQLEWDWWPLEPRMRDLKEGGMRLSWHCVCGSRQWLEVSTQDAELIVDILVSSDTKSSMTHRCRPKTGRTPLKLYLNRMINWATAASSAERKYTPPKDTTNLTSLTTTTNTDPSTDPTEQLNLPKQHRPSQPGCSTSNQQPPATSAVANIYKHLYILFGVQGSRRPLEIDHILVDDTTQDHKFYRSLRERYRIHRGKFRLWFSFWRFRYCEVVRFKHLAPKFVIRDCKDLPKSQDYVYQPRPPIATNPPISRHEFEMHLSACDEPCRWAWSYFHECMPPLMTSQAISCIPKKAKQFDTTVASTSNCADDAFAWGLQARHAISAFYVLIYHVIIVIGPLVFWGFWIQKHPGDWQNASVPITVIIGMLSLFWCTNGILTQGREL